jgi:hypothetical protein
MSLRWRIAAAVAGLLVVFALVLGMVVTAVVSGTLENYQRTLLAADAEQLQQLYRQDTPGSAGDGELLGGSSIAIFDSTGDEFSNNKKLEIPRQEVIAASQGSRFWRSERLLVLLEPIAIAPNTPKKVLVVAASAEYINDLASRVQVATAITTAVLVVLALLAGYVLAQLGLRPLVSVARQAQELSITQVQATNSVCWSKP